METREVVGVLIFIVVLILAFLWVLQQQRAAREAVPETAATCGAVGGRCTVGPCATGEQAGAYACPGGQLCCLPPAQPAG